MAASALRWTTEERSEARDPVHHRTRATRPDGKVVSLVVVNTSPGGLMARCDTACNEGDRLRIELPGVGQLPVEVRWSLGGRIGCRVPSPMRLEDYYAMLSAMRR
ncbi:PilZ domain-containing protein [Sphingomonas sp.]|uniref:PilZ domain-containing protein n=1 Tax=Sphingomonas sp. TaxID=28214 RepID=UPI003B00C861